MAQTKIERLKKLLGDDFPKPVAKPTPKLEDLALEQNPELASTSTHALTGSPSSTTHAKPQGQQDLSSGTSRAVTVSTSQNTQPEPQGQHKVTPKPSGPGSSKRPLRPFCERTVLFDTHDPNIGRLAEGGAAFCPIVAVSKYPYKFVPPHLTQKIAEEFFDDGKFWYQPWDVYYCWPEPLTSSKPLLLIPAEQVEQFLQEINHVVKSYLVLGAEAEEFGLVLKAPDHPSLRPRFLGRSTTREMFTSMEKKVPDSEHFPNGEIKPSEGPDRTTLDDWKYMMQLAFEVSKTKNKAAKAAKKNQRILKQQQWKDSLKRAERFLGFRPVPSKPPELATDAGWEETKAFFDNQDKPAAPLAPVTDEAAPPYPFDQHPIFVSVDVECYEHDKSKVTEIGIAILDTTQLRDECPGANGINWQKHIRARHYRIKEHSHLRNGDFVSDAAEKFQFPEGGSEFVDLADAPQVIAACFRHPYCERDGQQYALSSSDRQETQIGADPDGSQHPSSRSEKSEPQATADPEDASNGHPPSSNEDLEPPKRTLVLVGHDIGSDVRYLRRVGYDLGNLSNLHTTLDTASLHRALVHEWNPKSLAGLLWDFELVGWHPHNAGNDAVHTLWAMVAIVLKSATQRGDPDVQKKHEERKVERIEEAVVRAGTQAIEEGEGWSTGGEDNQKG